VIALRSDLKVVLAAQPVDFRKSLHTLSALVSEALRANPYCGDVFVSALPQSRDVASSSR
jgi:transposase